MGYRTPNIDRIASEGARFTDWYGQQGCTAGRAAFITGQAPIRTGLYHLNAAEQPESPDDPRDPNLRERFAFFIWFNTTPMHIFTHLKLRGGLARALRWPGVIEPGTLSNEIFSHTDMLPTLLAAAGEPDVIEKLKQGHQDEVAQPPSKEQPAVH